MRFIYAILLCILIVASTVSVVSYNKKAVGQTPPLLVEAIPARLEAWQKKTQAVGSLSASQGTVIKAETTGRITAIYFRSGENVKVGTPLQLNPDILKAQLDGAKAATKLSKADYERV